MLNLGLAVSVFHLGRPLGAWRFFLGLRTSWMSREILVFSLFAASAAAFAGTCAWNYVARWGSNIHIFDSFGFPTRFAVPLAFSTATLGLLGVFSSAMIYVDTRRVFWRGEMVFTKFFGTTLLLGASVTAAVFEWTGLVTSVRLGEPTVVLIMVSAILGGALLGWESQYFRQAFMSEMALDRPSAEIMWRLQRPLLFARVTLSAGAIILALCAAPQRGFPAAITMTLSCLLACAAQVIERYSFFTAVIAPRMPGPALPDSSAHA
jgi:DMSO reductase anchor subunit